MKKEDLLGQRFGRLVVIGEAEPIGKRKRTAWLCRCDCRVEKVVKAEDLKRGHVQSCGCLNDEKRRERAPAMYGVCVKFHPSETSARRVWKRRYSDGDLTFEDFMRISQLDCHYCGAKPNNIANAAADDNKSSQYARENGDFTYNGLDRIDSSKPHDLNNVVSCCKWCNYAKRERTVEEFGEWVERLYDTMFGTG